MISKQDHVHERDPNQIGRCKHCSMWQCFNGRWHEAGTTCITAECKQELELASKEIKPHLTAEEIAKRHGFIPRSYSPCQFEKCVAAIKEFLSQVPETLYCDVCESELQRESCNHVRTCPKCTLEGPVQKPQRDACQVCEGWRGGVPGNENIVRGVTMCDYCSATVVELEKLGLMPAAPGLSQPARAQKWLENYANSGRGCKWLTRSLAEGAEDTICEMLNAYATQQTAAKDAEIRDYKEAVRHLAETIDVVFENRVKVAEQRAEATERELAQAHDTNRKLNRDNQSLQHSLSLESTKRAWHRYFTCAMKLFSEEADKREAAERERDSLREALKEALLYDINMDLRITIEATLKAGKDGQQ